MIRRSFLRVTGEAGTAYGRGKGLVRAFGPPGTVRPLRNLFVIEMSPAGA